MSRYLLKLSIRAFFVRIKELLRVRNIHCTLSIIPNLEIEQFQRASINDQGKVQMINLIDFLFLHNHGR